MSITLLLFLKFHVINRKWFIQRIALTHGIASYANFLEQKIILRQKEVKSKDTRVGVYGKKTNTIGVTLSLHK